MLLDSVGCGGKYKCWRFSAAERAHLSRKSQKVERSLRDKWAAATSTGCERTGKPRRTRYSARNVLVWR